MAVDAKKVYVGTPDQLTTGAILQAPLGTTVPDLQDITPSKVTLDEGFKDCGYVSEDGVTITPDYSTSDIPSWGGAVVRRILEQFGAAPAEEDGNWSRRYRDNMLRIKSGDIEQLSSVLFLLMKRERDRGLSTGERKMMVSARQIFVSELSLAIGSPGHEIERRLAENLV